jgi:hypothetical protein
VKTTIRIKEDNPELRNKEDMMKNQINYVNTTLTL